jgi:hypothetical protein
MFAATLANLTKIQKDPWRAVDATTGRIGRTYKD